MQAGITKSLNLKVELKLQSHNKIINYMILSKPTKFTRSETSRISMWSKRFWTSIIP